jgi:hypothetical protein
MTEMELFIEEGKSLLNEISKAHAVALVSQESANNRIKVIQWIIIVILAPLMLATGNNSIQNALKMDKSEVYEKFPTKASSLYFQNDIYDMNKSSFVIKSESDELSIDKKYTKAQKEFIGDVTRSSN